MTRFLATICAFSVASCNLVDGTAARTCGATLTAFPEVPVQEADWEKGARACVDRWSARLARGPDSITEVADAVVAGCHQEIERLQDGQIVSYNRNKPLEPEWRAYWHGRAMFVIAQSRAADCYSDA